MSNPLNKILGKIKELGNKKVNLTTVAFGMVIIAAAAVLTPQANLSALSRYVQPQTQPALPRTASGSGGSPAPSTISLASLETLGAYNGLPVSSVESHPVTNAQGTVILIPQYHRDPTTTNILDPANDSGQRDQEQTVDILKYLSTKASVNLIMVEGDLQGDVPQGKIDHIKNEISARDQFAASIDNLKQQLSQGQANPAGQQLLGQLQQELNNVNRDIYLQGAPYVVKAQGSDVTLVGAENQKTLDAAANVVRDYVYLNDRLTQLKQPQVAAAPQAQPYAMGANPLGGGANPLAGGNMQQMLQQYLQQMMARRGTQQVPQQMGGAGNPLAGVAGGNMQQIIQQLMGGGSAASPEQSLTTMQSQAQAQGNQALSSALSQVQQAYQNVKSSSQTFSVATTASSTSNAPSRANNPYSKITDANQVQSMLKQSEQKVNEVVIGQRNQAAAANIVQSMKDHNQSVAILQFGAGHQDGLVQELNKQNLNVIVVTPNEVAARATQQQA